MVGNNTTLSKADILLHDLCGIDNHAKRRAVIEFRKPALVEAICRNDVVEEVARAFFSALPITFGSISASAQITLKYAAKKRGDLPETVMERIFSETPQVSGGMLGYDIFNHLDLPNKARAAALLNKALLSNERQRECGAVLVLNNVMGVTRYSPLYFDILHNDAEYNFLRPTIALVGNVLGDKKCDSSTRTEARRLLEKSLRVRAFYHDALEGLSMAHGGMQYTEPPHSPE